MNGINGDSMNILLVCNWDNGGQMIALAKALNKYTDHDARTITFKETYLAYETDVVDPTMNRVKELVEWADFYILGELLPFNDFTKPIYGSITPINCILRAGGSIARAHPEFYMKGILGQIMKTGGYHDWSLSLPIHPMANTVNIYHFDEFPPEQKMEAPPYRLLFSGTKFKEKRADIIQEAWNQLKTRKDLFSYQVHSSSWQKSLEEKALGHIQFDHSLLLGAYASNSVEAMFYHMPVFCSASGWCRTTYPDLPVIHTIDSKELTEKTIELIENPDLITEIGNKGHEFVMKYHDAKEAVKRWTALIEYITTDYHHQLSSDMNKLNKNMEIK